MTIEEEFTLLPGLPASTNSLRHLWTRLTPFPPQAHPLQACHPSSGQSHGGRSAISYPGYYFLGLFPSTTNHFSHFGPHQYLAQREKTCPTCKDLPISFLWSRSTPGISYRWLLLIGFRAPCSKLTTAWAVGSLVSLKTE